jgi:hypothetical protein
MPQKPVAVPLPINGVDDLRLAGRLNRNQPCEWLWPRPVPPAEEIDAVLREALAQAGFVDPAVVEVEVRGGTKHVIEANHPGFSPLRWTFGLIPAPSQPWLASWIAGSPCGSGGTPLLVIGTIGWGLSAPSPEETAE